MLSKMMSFSGVKDNQQSSVELPDRTLYLLHLSKLLSFPGLTEFYPAIDHLSIVQEHTTTHN